MSLLAATIRETKTKGEVKSLRSKGMVPGIIYGGEEPNQKISVSVKEVKNLLNKENILSNIISINIDGKEQKVLPRVIDFDTVTDEPIHLDFLRIVKGAKVILEIPVKFINHELSPGLKRGGVLNIVRRKVELRCPTENIPTELVVDLNNLDIGASIKISFINLPENVTPTIQGRDFVSQPSQHQRLLRSLKNQQKLREKVEKLRRQLRMEMLNLKKVQKKLQMVIKEKKKEKLQQRKNNNL